MKIKRTASLLTVVTGGGEVFSRPNISDPEFQEVINNLDDEDYVISSLFPEFATERLKELEREERRDFVKNLKKKVGKSNLLEILNGDSVIMPSVSKIAMPELLVKKVLKAEKAQDEKKLSSYRNFWMLTSLNPDYRVRRNLFWFLEKYGMKISSSGFFIAYRNADLKQLPAVPKELLGFVTSSVSKLKAYGKDISKYVVSGDKENGYVLEKGGSGESLDRLYKRVTDDRTGLILTDNYTKRFDIRLGQFVTMPRENCDSTQENSCSRGLHVASKGWLSQNYFGAVGLMVLVNPSDVVAVPPIDDYGKMRTCAYLPVAVVDYGEDGKVKELEVADSFEDGLNTGYEGEVSDHDPDAYRITLPEDFEGDITETLSDIAEKLSRKIKHMGNERP